MWQSAVVHHFSGSTLTAAMLVIGVANGSCVSQQARPSATREQAADEIPHERDDTAASSRVIAVLTTSAHETDFCDGEKTDSDGFRKTLTVEKSVTLPPADAPINERVRAVLDAATTGMCQTAMRQLDYRLDQGTLHVPPFDGWAGVSIVMCWCRPELEVNLARLPGVDRVVWDYEQH
jgi:hypothetical protein